MKKFYTLLCTVLFTVALVAQAPQKISYQAVIRNSSNVLVASTAIGMRISILQGSGSGTAVYVETQSPTTNANGLAAVEIGGGSVVSGVFANIDWSAGPYFIKTEIAVVPPLTTYTITGTSQLLSVPYALAAKTAASYTETDPIYTAWNKSSGISVTASQVSDFQTSVTNNAAVLLNTAKISYPPADAAKVALLSGTNTGDETAATIKTKLGITTLSGSNTGDQTLAGLGGVASNPAITAGTRTKITFDTKGLVTAGADATTADIAASANKNYVTDAQLTIIGNTSGTNTGDNSPNTLYSGFVSNATHTGDATGATALKVVGINNVILSGLATGILKNTTGTGVPSIAVAGDFPILNQNTTGSAASFTGNLVGEVTGTQGATVVGNAAVIGKVLTNFTSGPGTITAADNILQAIQKLNGNVVALAASGAHYLGESYLGGIVFNIYKDNLGNEHGLVVSLTETAPGSTPWGPIATPTGATRTWDGATNSPLMGPEVQTYLSGLGAGWYVPAIDELRILINNRFYVNKALQGGGGTLILYNDYWSSTEIDQDNATSLYFREDHSYVGPKTGSGCIRAIKSF